jgi:hypothetical protein
VTAETMLAAIGLAVCVVLLVRMAIGQRRRDRLDAGLQRSARQLRQDSRGLWQRRRLRGQAERETEDLIDRVRRGRTGVDRVQRDGNVIRPSSFNGGADERRPDGRHRRDH